jgi:nucleotide-binding universal stress UspA family protein
MSTPQTTTLAATPAADPIFERILVGVDGTKESLDACRQAARMAEPHSAIVAAFASLFPPETATALGVQDVAERLEHTADSALAAAWAILGPEAELRRLQGLTVDALLKEAERTRTTLLAIGTHGHSRVEEIVLGGVAGELLHRARSAVLVARPVPDIAAFPREIVVGIDGSDEAERAFEVASRLAIRRHSIVRSVVAHGGKRVNFAQISRRHHDAEDLAGAPVPALLEAAACADLLVVGSRGLHGLRALGSVSERVAHQATCSVLVVRES